MRDYIPRVWEAKEAVGLREETRLEVAGDRDFLYRRARTPSRTDNRREATERFARLSVWSLRSWESNLGQSLLA